jgi:DNA topoisomerase I
MPKTSLVIVESPAKARTLKRYLGKKFNVKASVGHIRDLPVKKLGVDVDNDFTPQYVTIRGKGKILTELKNAAKKADEILLAPDPDREGEAIAWHIANSLKNINKPVKRALFHELTKKAILSAIDNATEINYKLFEAQQARRILDRLVGYKISPLLWSKVRRGLSAGRVQSVAVRMICEREKKIKEFVSQEYWSIDCDLKGKIPPQFTAALEKISGKNIKGKKYLITDEKTANTITSELEKAPFSVAKIEKKERKRYPSPPFITSTLQQEANRKLRFSAKKTMTLAQKLYEGIDLGDGPSGLITYMRTDSIRLSSEAIDEVREMIGSEYGADYLPAKPIIYKTKKNAQDAHEAVRPTDALKTPETLKPYLEKDMLSLYTLIWKRFVACQMSPARFDQTSIAIESGKYQLKAVGTIMKFLGFIKLYVESVDEQDSQAALPSSNKSDLTLPDLKKGDVLELQKILPKQHFTQPPPRYTEATLVKALEENGVGRPSTYASILSTIQDKEYVELNKRKFEPTNLGDLVNGLLVEHFPKIIDTDFTASMEKDLDLVEEGKTEWLKILQTFYDPFKETLEKAKKEMKSVKQDAVPTEIDCSLCEGKMVIKWGRMGEFLACENYPDCKNTQNFTKSEDGEIVPVKRDEPEESDQVCEKCGKPMLYKQGRFGKFLACSGYPECKHIQSPTTGVKCPNEGCDGDIVEKKSRRGKVFYSCNRYPKCKYAIWDKPVQKECPTCKAKFLVEKTTKKQGLHLRCAEKSCDYQEDIK